jgi:hypothetical protein
MAGTFPTLSSGRIAYDGSEQSLVRKTDCIQFVNDTECRWKTAQPLFSAVLRYTDASSYDIGLLQKFFLTQKGQLDSTWTLIMEDALGSFTTYNFMKFEQDTFPISEDTPGRFSTSLKMRQTRKN